MIGNLNAQMIGKPNAMSPDTPRATVLPERILSEPTATALQVVIAAGVSAGAAVAIQGTDFVFYGHHLPVAGLAAAMAGAAVPQLIVGEETIWRALKFWLAGVIVACIATPAVILATDWPPAATVSISGCIAIFGRDIVQRFQGELPPMVTFIRRWITGAREGS